MNDKSLPSTLTTLDLIKTAAVVLMVADHIGFFFFPVAVDPINEWWRVAGRMCVPIWFFLIGYARTREIPPAMIAGAVFLLSLYLVSGLYVFPMNILFSMMIIRLILDPIALLMFKTEKNFWIGVGTMFLLAIPSLYITEYGTLGLVLALLGAAVRARQDKVDGASIATHRFFGAEIVWMLYGGASGLFFVTQLFSFSFDLVQLVVMMAGSLAILAGLTQMHVRTHPRLAAWIGLVGTRIIQWSGRHTLVIYVGHITIFLAAAWVFGLGHPIYGLFQWEWTAPETFAGAS